MSDVIGKGVIEVSADATKLKAGIEDAKRSIKSLGIASGDATKSQSQSIDRYVKQLGIAAVTTGKTGRELELYKLALRGANAEQLKAADSALRMTEAYAKGEEIGAAMRRGFLMLGAAAVTGLIAAAAAFDTLVKKAGDFQDMAEKTGDTAVNFASLAVAAGTTKTAMDTVAAASVGREWGIEVVGHGERTPQQAQRLFVLAALQRHQPRNRPTRLGNDHLGARRYLLHDPGEMRLGFMDVDDGPGHGAPPGSSKLRLVYCESIR